MAPPVREAQELSSSPSADYTATPLESDLFEWHFTLRGPPNSVYAEGMYHGRIVLPPTYPLRPPSFRFVTPSGRFEANREICLSISGHHEETWQPAWGVRTALVALRAFMETDPRGQLGGLDASDAVRRRLAAESRAWRCPACGPRSNQAILADCEAAAREADAAAGAARPEVSVPADLKMGWRDEMGVAAKPDDESARLAEGFVQTGGAAAAAAAAAPPPSAPVAVHEASRGPEAVPVRVPARPGQGVPQPTRTVPLPNPAAPTLPRQAQLHRHSDDAVPLWIDRTIVILGVLLGAMLLKVLAGV